MAMTVASATVPVRVRLVLVVEEKRLHRLKESDRTWRSFGHPSTALVRVFSESFASEARSTQ